MKILWLFLFAACPAIGQVKEHATVTSSDYAGVSGNPYFIKDWADGIIRFSNGKVSDKFKLKFNVAQNSLMLQFKGSTFAAESKITEFVLYSRNKTDSFVFRKGFPDADRGNKETFYRVLEEGKATLLMLAAKDIVEEKEILASKQSRHFQDVEQFYVFKDGKMDKIDKENNALPDILADKREELKVYIAEQQVKIRTSEDLIKVVRKYNQL